MSIALERVSPNYTKSVTFFHSGTSTIYTAILGFIWGGISYLFLQIRTPTVDWLILTFLVGFPLQFLWYFWVKHHFKKETNNQEILLLAEKAERTLGYNYRFEIWERSKDEAILTSASNILFNAVLLSPSAITAILNDHRFGEPVIASELVKMKHTPRAIGMLYYSGHFTWFAMLQDLLFAWELIELYDFDILLMTAAFGFGLLIMGGAVFSRTRRNLVDKSIMQFYDVLSEEAKAKVFGVSRPAQRILDESVAIGKDRFRYEQMDLDGGQLIIALIIGATIGGIVFSWLTLVRFTFLHSITIAFFLGSVIFSITFRFSTRTPSYEPRKIPKDTLEIWVEDDATMELQEWMQKLPELSDCIVRRDDYWDDEHLRVFSRPESPRSTLCWLDETIINCIESPEHRAVYALAEIRRNRIHSKSARRGISAVLGLGLLVFIHIVYSALVIRESPLFIIFLTDVVYWIIFSSIVIGVLIYHHNRRMREMDVITATEYPALVAVLECLSSCLDEQPEKVFEFKKRLTNLQMLHSSHAEDF